MIYEGRKFLIVDFDTSFKSSLGEALKKEGVECFFAKETDEAIEIIHNDSYTPDLILIEAMLPKGSGFELCKRIKNLKKCKDVPVIMMSAVYKSVKHQMDAKNIYGANDFLAKPFVLRELFDKVNKFIEPYDDSICLESDIAASGQLQSETFFQLFRFFYEKKFTGILEVKKDSVEKSIYFEEGFPVHVKSFVLSECLGRALLNAGKINYEVYNTSLQKMVDTKQKQGEILLEMGVVTEKDLMEGLKLQQYEKIINAFQLIGGNYSYERISTIPDTVERFNLEPIYILNEWISKHVPLYYINESFEKVKNRYPFIVDAKVSLLENYDFSPEVYNFFRSFDGSASLTDIINLIDPGDFKKVQLIFLLKSFGILSFNKNPIKKQIIINSPKEPVKDSKTDPPSVLEEKLKATLVKMIKQNPFEVLGVDLSSEKKEIRKAYLKLVKKYHPDNFYNKLSVSGKKSVDEIFKRVGIAYQILRNEETRKGCIEKIFKKSEDVLQEDKVNIINAEIQFQKGLSAFKRGNFSEAKECFRWAASLNPVEAEFQAYLGWTVYKEAPEKKSVLKDVEETLKKAIALNPKFDMSYLFLGRFYKFENKFSLAEEYFQKAVAVNPNCMEAMGELKAVKIKQQSLKEDKKDEKKSFLGKFFK